MYKKAKDLLLTQSYLEDRAYNAEVAGYPKAKWIEFCEILLKENYELTLYEAKETYSKYITVMNKTHTKKFKVRFSDHVPILWREIKKDCDFFVGKTNLRTTNTTMALAAVRAFFDTTIYE